MKTRLPGVSLITKFLDDSSFSQLCHALLKGQREEAFRAVHTLEGVCANLGFDQLGASAGKLTELHRPERDGIPENAVFILNEVKHDHELTADVIRTYLDLENLSEWPIIASLQFLEFSWQETNSG